MFPGSAGNSALAPARVNLAAARDILAHAKDGSHMRDSVSALRNNFPGDISSSSRPQMDLVSSRKL